MYNWCCCCYRDRTSASFPQDPLLWWCNMVHTHWCWHLPDLKGWMSYCEHQYPWIFHTAFQWSAEQGKDGMSYKLSSAPHCESSQGKMTCTFHCGWTVNCIWNQILQLKWICLAHLSSWKMTLFVTATGKRSQYLRLSVTHFPSVILV